MTQNDDRDQDNIPLALQHPMSGAGCSNTVSVIIPTKNRPREVLACIRSVERQSIQPIEIVVVDASGVDGLESLVSNTATGNIRVVYTRSDAGLTRQKNIGVKKSSGDIVLILDDDIILCENYVEELLSVFNSPHYINIGSVYGDQILPHTNESDVHEKRSSLYSLASVLDAKLNAVIRICFFLQIPTKTGRFRLSGLATRPPYLNPSTTVSETEAAPGGYTAYYRNVLEEFSFDERLEGYGWGEDADISYRISRKYRHYFNPKAKVIHVSKTPKMNSYPYSKMRIEYHHYLFKKNFPQGLKNRFAFNMSLFGLFLNELEFGIVRRDFQGLRGFFDGLRVAHNKSGQN
ncbi:MAG: glycosyltransferase family 2 protein [Halobacteriota archaeon]